MKTHTIAFLFTTLIACISCGDSSKNEAAASTPETPTQGLTTWTDAIKASIVADFEKGVDSTVTVPAEDGFLVEIYSYRNGQLKLKKTMTRDDRTVFEVFTAGANGEFELRRKYYPSGQMAYEGTTYYEEHCGMDSWWHPNGQLEHQGLRFRSKNFGKWPYWKEDGTLDKEDNFGMMEYLDSLATIKFASAN